MIVPSRARVFRLILPALLVSSAWTAYRVDAQPRSSPAPAKIPLVAGLVTVGAVREPDKGDYESILTVDSLSADAVGYSMSGNVGDRRFTVKRSVRTTDMTHAHEWRPRYSEGDPVTFPGTTGGTLSADMLNELKSKGSSTLKAFVASSALGGLLGGLLGGTAGAPDSVEGTIRRVEPQPVPVSMLVNDNRVDLPAIHARGTLGDDTFDVYVLDDPAMPLVLQWSLADTSKRLIRISYPGASVPSHIEEKLNSIGRAEVYGIYFDFAKATIRPESEQVLKDIAEVMVKNAAWKLTVEGHTDNIGGATANQELSSRRAAAVRQALIDRYHVAADRLTPAGFGASRPKETNATLEGRARNRRVELVRQPGALDAHPAVRH